MTFAHLDLAGIQGYVFGSNRLAEIVGASYLAGTWLAETVNSEAKKANGTVYFAGGGGALIGFKKAEEAQTFVGATSLKLILEAPGLRCRFWIGEGAPTLWTNIGEALEARKRQGEPDARFGGLGVVRACAATREPASQIDGTRKRKVSTATASKLRVGEKAKTALASLLPLGKKRLYPDEFDLLGGSHDEKNQIAVVHIDGDGFGKRIVKAMDEFAGLENYEKLGELSKKLDQCAVEAMKALITKIESLIGDDHVLRHPCETDRTTPVESLVFPGFQLDRDIEGNVCFPLRLLLLAGDDITFVCDARIGVSAAAFLSQELQKRWKDDLLGLGDFVGATLSAGVCIIPVKYPFTEAYRMAEAACRSAKEDKPDLPANTLDWHVATQALPATLAEVRGDLKIDIGFSGTQTNHALLHQRPVRLGTTSCRDFQAVQAVVLSFQKGSEGQPRSVAKGLRGSLRGGPDAVRALVADRKMKLPEVPGTDHPDAGFFAGRSCYWDAIELMDIYIPLEVKNGV